MIAFDWVYSGWEGGGVLEGAVLLEGLCGLISVGGTGEFHVKVQF